MSKVKNTIKALDFPESVRKRSVVYMGDSNNSNHALTEAVDNAADHVFRDPSVTKISIKTCKNDPSDYMCVANDGVSFPIKWNPDRGMTESHLAAVHMHSGSNFDGGNTSIGQNGLGITCTNALSDYFYIITKLTKDNLSTTSDKIRKEGKPGDYYYIKFKKGILVEESVGTLKDIEKIDGIKLPKDYSTYIVSKPDPIIYTEDLSGSIEESRIEDSILVFRNFYNRTIKYTLNGKVISASDVGFRYKALVDYPNIADLVHAETMEDEDGNIVPDTSSRIVLDHDNPVNVKYLLDFEFSTDLDEINQSGNVNTRKVPRGIHINRGKELIGDALKEVFNITHDYLTKGIRINALVLAPGSHLQLAGQTKDSLIRIKCFNDPEYNRMKRRLVRVIRHHKEEILPHVTRLNEYAATMEKLEARDFVKSMVNMNKNGTPIVSRKVRDATSDDRSKCSLYIVEGQSAASSLLDARDIEFHGVFAMRGFSLNTVGISIEKVFENEEYADLISAIGAGVDIYNDIDHVRYGKIIICADADSDGAAITNLILGMMGEHMSYLIDHGLVYVNQSPLYEQGGKYFRADEEHLVDRKKPYTRFKGLGELSVDQAEDVFFGDHQRLLKITKEGLQDALDLILYSDKKKELMLKHKIIK